MQLSLVDSRDCRSLNRGRWTLIISCVFILTAGLATASAQTIDIGVKPENARSDWWKFWDRGQVDFAVSWTLKDAAGKEIKDLTGFQYRVWCSSGWSEFQASRVVDSSMGVLAQPSYTLAAKRIGELYWIRVEAANTITGHTVSAQDSCRYFKNSRDLGPSDRDGLFSKAWSRGGWPGRLIIVFIFLGGTISLVIAVNCFLVTRSSRLFPSGGEQEDDMIKAVLNLVKDRAMRSAQPNEVNQDSGVAQADDDELLRCIIADIVNQPSDLVANQSRFRRRVFGRDHRTKHTGLERLPTLRIIAEGVEAFARFGSDDREAIRLLMLQQCEVETNSLWHRCNLVHLLHLGNTLPLLGLLGTVIGLSNAFLIWAVQRASEQFSADIGVALITTLLGLALGIPSTIVHHWYANKLARVENTWSDMTKRISESA